MRNVAAIFFLLIFSFQVLPIKAIGKLLAKNQMTEEVKQDCSDTDDDNKEDSKEGKDDNKEGKYNDLFHNIHAATPIGDLAIKKKVISNHGSDDLPNSYVEDIICPPPNC